MWRWPVPDPRIQLWQWPQSAGGWQDAPYYSRDPISITRGRGDEQGAPTPSSCSATLDNTSGAYRRIPRNTPLRVVLDAGRDTFGRTLSSGWGSTDDGLVWAGIWSGGTQTPSDWSVADGVGRHRVPATNAYRMSTLPVSILDAEVRVTVSMAVTDITGGSVEPANIAFRWGLSQPDWLARMEVSPSEAVTLRLYGPSGELASATVTGLIWAGGPLRVAAAISGGTLMMKVWPASDVEPAAWQVRGTDEQTGLPGGIGIRSGVASGNTNTLPVEFRYADLEVVEPRVTGELASQKPDRSADWDPATGQGDAWTRVTAAGILRRLRQGTPPADSPLRRTYDRAGPLVYWPLEDARDADAAVSGVPGGAAMARTNKIAGVQTGAGRVDGLAIFGVDGSAGAASLVGLQNAGQLRGTVPASTATSWRFECVLRFDAGSKADPTPYPTMPITLHSGQWEWTMGYDPTGGIFVGAGDVNSSTRQVTMTTSWDPYDGLLHHYRLDVARNGANTDHRLYIDGVLRASATWAAFAAPVPQIVWGGYYLDAGAWVPCVGHLALWAPAPTVDIDTAAAATGRPGEIAADRLQRLCTEDGIAASILGPAWLTTPMGIQPPAAMTALMDEVERGDGGMLYEPRGEIGMAYRVRASLYRQTPRLVLDWSLDQVAGPLVPVPDDQLARNDVTVRRAAGSEFRAIRQTGPMSVAEIGRYDTRVDANLDRDDGLPTLAGWYLHLGTVDEDRWPQIVVDLAASPELAAAASAVDVGDRIQIIHVPADMSPTTIDQIVVGSTETWDQDGHRIALVCRPASAYQYIMELFSIPRTSGWGPDWTPSGGSATDYAVSGMGTISNGNTNVLRAMLADVGSPDVTVTTECQMPISAGVGAGYIRWIGARATDTGNCYVAQLILRTSGLVTLQLAVRVGGATTGLASMDVGSATAGTAWTVQLTVVGSFLRARAWSPAGPFAEATATDSRLTSGTKIMLGDRVEAGWTGSLPLVGAWHGVWTA